MVSTFVTGKGKTIKIGRELGKGGEGTVHEVTTTLDMVAKVYDHHHQPGVSKQAKLHFMATITDTELLNYVAWPQDTLHKTPNGPVVGFLMPRVSGRAPIHTLYSPAQRMQDYPQVAWDFLVFAARNTAAAFSVIHQCGHVLGDVNQNNVLVGADSKVILIDADSFQINVNGVMHLCGVGVPHFTPPELHGSTFDRVPRTSNHDNFGLALLIFHLLFGGRHPYSGVPLRKDAGEALENDIQAFRYAYAPDGRQRGFNPPPRSIPISIVSDRIQDMFTLAFTEAGPRTGRPTAQCWVEVLDELRAKLKRCSLNSMHIYPGHLAQCPWCTLEEDPGIVFFLDTRTSVSHTGLSGVSLAKIWAVIEAIPLPPSIVIPNVKTIGVTPTPLPPGIERQRAITFWRLLIAALALYLLTVMPKAWFAVLGVAFVVWNVVGGLGGSKRMAERVKRQEVRNMAQQTYDQIVGQVRQITSPEAFAKKKHSLALIRDEYRQLPEYERIEMANLHATAETRQKRQFLERQLIHAATIPRVGPAKKATLRSFGIETAADVTWNKVIAVPGFGEVSTRAVVDWQKTCERNFIFNPGRAITEADKNSVRARIAARQRAIETALNTGATELQCMRQEMMDKVNILLPQLHTASRELAQAEADLNIA